MGIRVIVSPNYQRAQNLMYEERLDPRRVWIVTDIESACRLRAVELKEDEVAWIDLPHSFPDVVEKIVRSAIVGERTTMEKGEQDDQAG